MKQQTTRLAENPAAIRDSARVRRFLLAAGLLTLMFVIPLGQLFRFAATSQFHSYILLVPFIAGYLIWLKRSALPAVGQPARLVAGAFGLAGTVVLAGYWLILRSRQLSEDDYLAVMTLAFLLFFYGVCGWFWGGRICRTVAFPLALLLFLLPIPTPAMPWIDAFLQHGSALAASVFFGMAGTPYLRDGLTFQLPGISLQVAPECSGIQSSLVLFIVGLLAAYLFLRTPWKRAVLVLLVIPLGLIRNGFRVFVIGELCVHIGPQMINSYIHRQGGPIFFALSLIPLFVLLVVLQKTEKRRGRAGFAAELSRRA